MDITGIWCHARLAGVVALTVPPPPQPRCTTRFKKQFVIDGFRRCASNSNHQKTDSTSARSSLLLKIAVSGATELLRLFSSSPTSSTQQDNGLYTAAYVQEDEPFASGIDDIVMKLKSDYENAYFVTGRFTSAIYAEDCIFEDPTIKFRGKQLYSRNLKLLVPFFDHPSIYLQSIEKVRDSQTEFLVASWKLRTYLKLPWIPFISISGSTVYDLDDQYKIVRHVESWNISPLEAIGQIFTPSSGKPGE